MAEQFTPKPKARPLKVYTNEVDTVCAHDEKDATQVLIEFIGCGPEDLGFSEEWRELDLKAVYSVRCDDSAWHSEQAGIDMPKGATILIQTSLARWAEHIGRGVIGSTEW